MAHKDPNDPRIKEAKLRHYYKNKEQYYARNEAKKKRLRDIIIKAKAVPCTDCGVQYPYYVMDFDHIGNDKEYSISRMANIGSLKKLTNEIAKCEVVCANCHRERTQNRRTCGDPDGSGL